MSHKAASAMPEAEPTRQPPASMPEAAPRLHAVDARAGEGPTRHFGLMVGESPAMHDVYGLIRKLHGIRVTVLIQGESGTGKEFAALALHAQGALHEEDARPFVAVNCGVFTPELVTSELFGHEKGSFTGALQRRRGYFEQANGGTLFLDEITEMSPELQAQLLRVLEAGSFLRVGGERPISADVRVIAATNRDPADAVRKGILREDLYYRLNAFPLRMPTLRERREDIPLLIAHFARGLERQHGVTWHPPEALIRRMQAHDWPGNVRELKNALHRAFLMRDREGEGAVDGFPAWRSRSGTHDLLRPGCTIAEMEKTLIINTLRHYSGDKDKAAKSLGVCLKTLYNRLNRYRHDDAVWH